VFLSLCGADLSAKCPDLEKTYNLLK
jgi:hypothetical protein